MTFMNPRYTFAALMSLLLAIALATLSVAAPEANSQRSKQLQELVNELNGHIESVRHIDHRRADLRVKLLADALESWNASGKSEADVQAMHSWLEASIRSSLPGQRGLFPAAPRFSEPVIVQVIPTPEPEASDATEPTPAVVEPESIVQTPKPEATLPAPEQPTTTPTQNDEPLVENESTLPWEKPEEVKPVVKPAPKQVVQAPKVEPPKADPPKVDVPKKDISKVATPKVATPEVKPPKVAKTFKPAPISEPAPTKSVVKRTQPSVTAKQTASVWKRHPAAKKIDLSNPFGDEDNTSNTTARIAMRPATMTVGNRTKVEVNTLELGARVRGYGHGLRGVEARLLADSAMSAEQLLRLVRELRELDNQRDMLTLYLGPDANSIDSVKLPRMAYAKRMAREQLEQLKQAGTSNERMLESIEAMLLAL